MDLRLVSYFVAVADHGSITRAAAALFVAQPSLSQAIRSLEGQIGLRLFDRAGGAATLTEEGREFLGVARRILADVDVARDRVAAVRAGESGRLTVAALAGLSVEPLPAIVRAFRARLPGVQVTVTDPGGAAAVADAVRRGQAEVGLTALPAGTPALETLELAAQEVVLALHPQLAAGLPDPLPWPPPTRIPLVVETPDTRSLPVDPLLGRIDEVAVECAHRAAIYALVQHGAGAAFLPRSAVETELSGIATRSIDPPLWRTVGVVFRPGPLSPAAEVFLAAARSLAAHPGDPEELASGG
ncbi:LysR family transcriptional regulator [Pseudonocardia sp. RS11V-5]|uniref:LysR family transcriptional regulator n=1 Tax=Pseudonocardia terrae TaxID=2905831 RepID=UPI001E37A3D0|nr:LysR family transcriptional regulator [Pseudonocardia terrae]MCE3555928.1 LysR family transcriptional regulator [Pseudonocardia terrae]